MLHGYRASSYQCGSDRYIQDGGDTKAIIVGEFNRSISKNNPDFDPFEVGKITAICDDESARPGPFKAPKLHCYRPSSYQCGSDQYVQDGGDTEAIIVGEFNR
jgi:hypothetical protein